MNQKSQTPDERFLLKIYQTALAKGDALQPIEYGPIARSIGIKETATKNIVKHLAQANFVNKVGEKQIHLTQHGCNFVLDHLC